MALVWLLPAGSLAADPRLPCTPGSQHGIQQLESKGEQEKRGVELIRKTRQRDKHG